MSEALGKETGLYPMRLVTRMTGLSSDTIRAWERRYKAIEPKRSQGNTRRFSAEEVHRLTLLREVTELGHPISAVASLSTPDLQALHKPQLTTQAQRESPAISVEDPAGLERIRSAYVDAVEHFETQYASEVLKKAAAVLDRRVFVFEIVLPVIRAVGDRWAHGTLGVAQEHFISAEMRSVLGAIAPGASTGPSTPAVLLTTPHGHRHEFGILAAAMLVEYRGYRPIYLGVDLPEADLLSAMETGRPKVVVMSIVRDVEAPELDALASLFGRLRQRAELWLGLPPGHPLVDRTTSARHFHDFESFDAALADRRPPSP